MELAIFIAVLAAMLVLAIAAWRGVDFTREDFFRSQRALMQRQLRLRVCALAALAVLGFAAQYAVSQQRLNVMQQQEYKLTQYQTELASLRVHYDLARAHQQQVLADAAPTEPLAAEQAVAAQPELASEIAEVNVARAVVREEPGGKARFTLKTGVRLHLKGSVSDPNGRGWREAFTEDGRSGWIASELVKIQ